MPRPAAAALALCLALAAPAPAQQGALAGRTIYLNPQDGIAFLDGSWQPIAPEINGIDEGAFTQHLATLVAERLRRAGAVVAPCRPIGQQPLEVIVDNDDPGVTFEPSAAWTLETGNNFFGTPGDEKARGTTDAATETATAAFVPDIPAAGFYPVYAWVAVGPDRVQGQLYRVRHTGGETNLRIDHTRVGKGWVWIGTYHFDAGSDPERGAVIVSNLRSGIGPTNQRVIADAIRFGNGMGDISRGGSISGVPREAEATRYWVQHSRSNGSDPGAWDAMALDDAGDSEAAAAHMPNEMRSIPGPPYHRDVLLSLRTLTADGSQRGAVALFSADDAPPSQEALAATMATEIESSLTSLEPSWEAHQPNTAGDDDLSLTNTHLRWPLPNGTALLNGVTLGVGHRDSSADAALLLDPAVQNHIARAAVHGLIRHFAAVDGGPLAFPPEPPVSLTASVNASGEVELAWAPGPSGAPLGDAATSYRVYRSPNGLGFAQPTPAVQPALTLANPGTEEVWFHVTALNAGGESLPSAVVLVDPLQTVRAQGFATR